MVEAEDDASFVELPLRDVNLDPAERERLMAAVQTRRYLPFCKTLSSLFGLEPSSMRQLLSDIDDPSRWTRGVSPVEGFLHFRPGPTLAPSRGGFVRMRSAWIPSHRHRDREVTFVLDGTLLDGEGRSYHPGQYIEMEPGSVHSVGVGEGSSALVALLHGGIDMLGD